MNNEGIAKSSMIGKGQPIEFFELNTFDLSGKKIYTTQLKYTTPKVGATDDPSYSGNFLQILPLKNQEGVILRNTVNGNGICYAVNNEGKMIKQVPFEIYDYKIMTTHIYFDKFNGKYFSMNDFENSPYVKKLASPVYKYFEGLKDKKDKMEAQYTSLKDGHILVLRDSKKDVAKLLFFKK